ncbi:hypothetical protein TSUD_194200 [Trifolium subterraneum]|uniref:Uncharacterized protein n=1 Tax=Trifolium subterraneum TaxID=3900 RepID=A0A2Z6PAB0_TRISU|nr:hypothetical protein TSUD_194200 [Trifolium subterraneum]
MHGMRIEQCEKIGMVKNILTRVSRIISSQRKKKKNENKSKNMKKRCGLECSLYEKTELGKQPTIFIAT